MSTSWINFLVIGILTVTLWFYYNESRLKMIELLSKNHILEVENQKLKTKVKYLHNYKTDVSKTFKILDNELKIIKNNIIPTEDVPPRVSLLTPDILTSLMNVEDQEENVPNANMFSSIFNRFLTSNLDFPMSQQIQTQPPPTPPPTPPTPPTPTPTQQPIVQPEQPIVQPEIEFNNNYSKYLIQENN